MAAVTATTAVKIPQPTSNFSQLLRRSKFASFDPAIRQTYSAPPAHAHRGQWGLKRPINLKRRGAFISLPADFEDRAYYIEWNHAENQVRFIKRFEEMQVTPKVAEDSRWRQVLGSRNRLEWITDSDFALREEGVEGKEVSVDERLPEQTPAPPPQATTTLSEYGKEGPGEYGSRARRIFSAANKTATPNVYRMTDRQFQKYLQKLRGMREEFAEFTAEQARKPLASGRPNLLLDKSMYHLAQDMAVAPTHHRIFLSKHFGKDYEDLQSRTIEPLPHFNGGLTYSFLSPLHTHLYSKYQPGIILHPENPFDSSGKSKNNNARVDGGTPGDHHVVSFGGLTSKVISKEVTNNSYTSLLDLNTEKGLVRENLRTSIAPMRIRPLEGVVLRYPPKVVGGKNSEGLKGVRMDTTVEIQTVNHQLDNPNFPGTLQYVLMPKPDKKGALAYQEQQAQTLLKPLMKRLNPNFASNKEPKTKEESKAIIDRLKGLSSPSQWDYGNHGL